MNLLLNYKKVSDKVPVAKREVIEVNKDTINAINLFDEKTINCC